MKLLLKKCCNFSSFMSTSFWNPSKYYYSKLNFLLIITYIKYSILGGSGLMLSCLGSLVGGFIIDSLGRKWSIYSTFLLNVVGWLILAATEYFLIGRLLLSFSIGKYLRKFQIKTSIRKEYNVDVRTFYINFEFFTISR